MAKAATLTFSLSLALVLASAARAQPECPTTTYDKAWQDCVMLAAAAERQREAMREMLEQQQRELLEKQRAMMEDQQRQMLLQQAIMAPVGQTCVPSGMGTYDCRAD